MEYRFDPDGTRITLSGSITELDDFVHLAAKLPAESTLDLGALTRINSSGVRSWVNFIRAVPGEKKVRLERCPVSFISQVNMVSRFVGHAEIRSLYLPCLCTGCEKDEQLLVQSEALRAQDFRLPPCASCQGALELDVLEDEYLSFLRR